MNKGQALTLALEMRANECDVRGNTPVFVESWRPLEGSGCWQEGNGSKQTPSAPDEPRAACSSHTDLAENKHPNPGCSLERENNSEMKYEPIFQPCCYWGSVISADSNQRSSLFLFLCSVLIYSVLSSSSSSSSLQLLIVYFIFY